MGRLSTPHTQPGIRVPIQPVIFAARTCTCGFQVTATSSLAAMDAMDDHYVAVQHVGLRAAMAGASTLRLGRKWTA